MTTAVVIVGMGEMGGVFARAFLRSGIPVCPVVRGMTLADAAAATPEPELVLKNAYILTTNIAGLKTGGNVGEHWSPHQPLARRIATEAIQLQEKLTGETLEADTLISGMAHAFEGDFEHQCMGRCAPARLKRAFAQANEYGLQLETLE